TTRGVGAQLGRVFDRSDAIPGIAEVAVISDALWKRRFGSDPHVLGTRIRIDNDMYSIIGVAPASFRHPGRGTETDVEVWAPAGRLGAAVLGQPGRRALVLEGGLRAAARRRSRSRASTRSPPRCAGSTWPTTRRRPAGRSA